MTLQHVYSVLFTVLPHFALVAQSHFAQSHLITLTPNPNPTSNPNCNP